MGLERIELSTSALSVLRSNRLSYSPVQGPTIYPAEGPMGFLRCLDPGEQGPRAARMVEQPAAPSRADPVAEDRPRHPGHARDDEHQAQAELALSGEGARRDQGRVPRPRYACAHDCDEYEQPDVFADHVRNLAGSSNPSGEQ